MTSRQWIGGIVLAVAVWLALASLHDSSWPPGSSERPTSQSTTVPGAGTRTAPPPGTASANSSTVVSGSAPATVVGDGGGAVTAAVTYLQLLNSTQDRARRRHLVAHLVVPDAVEDPPLADAPDVGPVVGPGQVLAIDATAAAVRVPTTTGEVILELRHTHGHWLIASLPEAA